MGHRMPHFGQSHSVCLLFTQKKIEIRRKTTQRIRADLSGVAAAAAAAVCATAMKAEVRSILVKGDSAIT